MLIGTEVWLEWWSNDNGDEIAKYMSVYVILAFAAVASRVSTIWFV